MAWTLERRIRDALALCVGAGEIRTARHVRIYSLPRAVSRKLWECRGRFAQRFSADVDVVRTYLFALVTDQLLGSRLRNPSFL